LTQAFPPSNPGWDPSATELSLVYSAIDTLLSNDTDPSVIIDVITNKDFDDGTFETELYFFDLVNLRQYGCVNLQQQAAGYTGKDLDELCAICMPFRKDSIQEDVQGTVGDVDNPDGSARISIQNQDPNTSVNPWEEFKGEYEAWRMDNPCPSPTKAPVNIGSKSAKGTKSSKRS
jgi:hypothetical protein